MEAKVKSLTRNSEGRYLLCVQLAGEKQCVIISFADREKMLAIFKNASEELSYVIKCNTTLTGTTRGCSLKVEDFDALLNYATATVTSATVEVAVTGDANEEQKADTMKDANAPIDASVTSEKKTYTNYYLESITLSRTGMLAFDRLCK